MICQTLPSVYGALLVVVEVLVVLVELLAAPGETVLEAPVVLQDVLVQAVEVLRVAATLGQDETAAADKERGYAQELMEWFHVLIRF